jgi:hypothetical protein
MSSVLSGKAHSAVCQGGVGGYLPFNPSHHDPRPWSPFSVRLPGTFGGSTTCVMSNSKRPGQGAKMCA